MKTKLAKAQLAAMSDQIYGQAKRQEERENGVSEETNELYVIANLLDDVIRRLEILEVKIGGNESC